MGCKKSENMWGIGFVAVWMFACGDSTMAPDSAIASDAAADVAAMDGASFDGASFDASADAETSDDAARDAGVDDPDAAPSDAGVDGSSPDAGGPGPVSITFAFRGELIEGMPVIFQNEDDSLVEIVSTDASGTATAIMRPGGSVSGVYETASQSSIYTFMDVQPGDAIRVGNPDPTFTNVSVTVPAVGGARPRYNVRSTCAGVLGTSTTASMRVLTGCTRADVFVGASRDGLPYDDYGAFIVPNVDLTGPVDLSAGVYAPSTPATVRLVNTPAGTRFGDSRLYVTTPSVGIWLLSATGESIGRYSGGVLTPSAMVDVTMPSVGGSEILAETSLSHTAPGGAVATYNIQERLAFTTEYELDLSTLTIPVLTEQAVQDDTGVVRWSEVPGGRADWVRAFFRTSRDGTIDRVVRAPYSGTSFRLPALPGDYDRLNPQPGDGAETQFMLLGQSPGGYDVFRQNRSDDTRDLLTGPGVRFVTSSVL